MSSSQNLSGFRIIEGIGDDMVYVHEGRLIRKPYRPGHNSQIFKGGYIESFYIGRFPVTQELWVAVMGSKAIVPSFEGKRRPMEMINWHQANDFIQQLNERTGHLYRLPTQAEWEYAARGGIYSRRYQFSGSNNLNEVGWYQTNSQNETHPVALKAPNELGIFDMSGNVWEWCEDPFDAGTESQRIIKGSRWSNSQESCSVYVSSGRPPKLRDNSQGFRLAHSVVQLG